MDLSPPDGTTSHNIQAGSPLTVSAAHTLPGYDDDLKRRILNTGCPINRLPVELLVKIFKQVHNVYFVFDLLLQAHERVEVDRPWYPMLGVCRHWKAVVTAAPGLWRQVYIGETDSVEYAKSLLARSGSHTIEVALDGVQDFASLVNELVRHRARISVLHVRRVPTSKGQIVSKLFDEPMPVLEELSMWFDDKIGGGPARDPKEAFMLDIRGVQLPQLRRLSLCGVGLKISIPTTVQDAPPLSYLELRDSIEPECDIMAFLAFLRSCPDLECLHLSRFRPFEEGFNVFVDQWNIAAASMVEFGTKLRRLVVEDLDAYAARLLSAMSVSPSTDVTVIKLISPGDPNEHREEHDLFVSPFNSCLPVDLDRFPILKQVNRAHVDWCRSNSTMHFVASSGNVSFSIGVSFDSGYTHPEPEIYPVEVADFLQNMPLTELWIADIPNLAYDSTHWSFLLGLLPGLRKLTIFFDRYGSDSGILDGLLLALQVTTPAGTMLCPELQELQLSAPTFDDAEAFAAILRVSLSARENRSGKRLRRLLLAVDSQRRDPAAPRPSSDETQKLAERCYAVVESVADNVQCMSDRSHVWSDLDDPKTNLLHWMQELV